jgi:HEAT repeat protein
MESSTFVNLLTVTGSFLPVLPFLFSRLLVSNRGQQITGQLKKHLIWIKNPTEKLAFNEAFKDAVVEYERSRGSSDEAQVVAKVLTHLAQQATDSSAHDRALFVQQIFALEPDIEILTDLVKRYGFALEGIRGLDISAIADEVQGFLVEFVRPSFGRHPQFAERIGNVEIISLFEELIALQREPMFDFDQLEQDYRLQMIKLYELISMEGISPKVQNQTIGVYMDDVFIPVKCKLSGSLSKSHIGHLVTISKGDLIQNLAKPQISDILSASAIQNNDIEELDEASLLLKALRYPEENGDDTNEVSEELLKLIQASYPFTIMDTLTLPGIVFQGDPGCGKSTLTRFLMWVVANKRAESVGDEICARIPIRIRAIEFGKALDQGRYRHLEDYLIEENKSFDPLIEVTLYAGNALVLVDGLDEVGSPSLQHAVKERMDHFIANPLFRDNRIIITSRIVGYSRNGLTGQFPHFTIQPLTNEQIESFIYRWYQNIEEAAPSVVQAQGEAKELIDVIEQKEGIRRLARNPLLLTIITLMKWQGRSLPEQRVRLYEVMTETLIRTWPLAWREINLDEFMIRETLAPVAAYVFKQPNSDLIDEYTLCNLMTDTLTEMRMMTQSEAEEKTQSLLRNITRHTGLLLEKGEDEDGRIIYGFLHQTFAEYLTALDLLNRWDDDELNLLDYVHDPYWREVILLMAGQLGIQNRKRAGKLVEAILSLPSSPYEEYVQRNLILAAQILADGVFVGPAETVRSLLETLVNVWATSPITALRKKLEDVLRNLSGTEYETSLAHLDIVQALSEDKIMKLSRVVGIPYFLELLDSTNLKPKNRLTSLRLLRRVSKKEAYLWVHSYLEDEDSEIRIAAAGHLVATHPDEAMPILRASLEGESSETRVAAAGHLLATHPDEAIPVLRASLEDEDNEIRMAAAGQLVAIQKISIDEAMHFLRGGIENIGQKNSYYKFQKGALAAISQISQSNTLSRHKFEFLLQSMIKSQSEITDLYSKLSDLTDLTDLPSLSSLQQEEFLNLPPLIIHKIRNELESDWVIDKLNENIPSLLQVYLEDENSEIRVEAAGYLMATHPNEAVPVLRASFEDKNENSKTRVAAARYLLATHPDEAVPVLREILSDGEVKNRAKAAKALLTSNDVDLIHANLNIMLEDSESPKFGDSVADIAFGFLQKHLTPDGKIQIEVTSH